MSKYIKFCFLYKCYQSELLELKMALMADERYEMKTSAKMGVSSTSRVFISRRDLSEIEDEREKRRWK